MLSDLFFSHRNDSSASIERGDIMSDEAIKLLKGLGSGTAKGIYSCTLGKIVKFDAEKMKAEVQPLAKSVRKDGTEVNQSLLIEVPVAHFRTKEFIIRPPYKPGDVVVVLFADQDLDNILLTGDISSPNTDRSHSISDAIVIGGIQPYSMAGVHLGRPDELVISTVKEKSHIIMNDQGDIEIKAKKLKINADKITISSEATVDITGSPVKVNGSTIGN